MKKLSVLFVFVFLTSIFMLAEAKPSQDKACFGQASAVFAQMGAMGEHSSSFNTPRLGLRNLAVALYDAGILSEPTLQALGAWVANELGLSIESCLE